MDILVLSKSRLNIENCPRGSIKEAIVYLESKFDVCDLIALKPAKLYNEVDTQLDREYVQQSDEDVIYIPKAVYFEQTRELKLIYESTEQLLRFDLEKSMGQLKMVFCRGKTFSPEFIDILCNGSVVSSEKKTIELDEDVLIIQKKSKIKIVSKFFS